MTRVSLRSPGGLENLVLSAAEPIRPGPGELLVRIYACSLNFHDHAVATGIGRAGDGRILLSDGAGDVLEVGAGVTEFAAGDLIVSTFFPDWLGGAATPARTAAICGEHVDGYASTYVTRPQERFTHAPANYTHREAATLPCAGLTAWRALVVEGALKAGDVVLVQGTGGVSVFALQFAKAAGATVIATSSSDDKLDLLRGLGADHFVNYRANPAWGETAFDLAGDAGVDIVIDIGGPTTLPQSMAACRMGGRIACIGGLAGHLGELSSKQIYRKQLRLQGLMVGSREQQVEMIRAVSATGLRPVIDQSAFELADLVSAFQFQQRQVHTGKICVDV